MNVSFVRQNEDMRHEDMTPVYK